MDNRLSKGGSLSLSLRARLRLYCRFAAVVLFCATTLPAGVVQVFSSAALDASDFIGWGQLGPFVPQPFIPALPSNPEPVISDNGLALLASAPLDLYEDRQAFSTAYCNCWNGNFAPGDYLIGSGSSGGPTSLTLTFSAPIYGIGTQMGFDGYGPFTGMMQLFGPLGDSLGSYTVAGNSADTVDNSAVFIGALSSDPIGSVTFSTSYSFAINQVDLVTSPEPGSLLLCLAGIALLGRKFARAL
jgi:hypothetical protein